MQRYHTYVYVFLNNSKEEKIMKIRKFAVLAVSAAMMLAGVSNAQDMGMMGCPGGLAQADCDVIAAATANTLALTSFNQDWTINFSVSGIPDSEPLVFDVSGSGPVVLDMSNAEMPLSFEQQFTVSASGGGAEALEFSSTAIVQDNMFYVDLGDGDWRVLDIAEAQESGAAGLPINPQDLASGEGMEQLAGILPTAMALAEAPGFLNYVREGDDFTFTADFSSLFTSQEFSTIITQLSETADSETQQVLGMASILPMIMQEGTITVVQSVDAGANLVTGLSFTVDVTIDPAMLAGMMGGGADVPTEPIVVSLNFNVAVSDPNGAFEITAPADAQPFEGMGGM
jgi:hypothetical protein